MVFSRGCRHKCIHCTIPAINNGQLAYRKANEIVKDIERSPSKLFYFVDDNLLSDRDRFYELLLCIKKSGVRKRWAGQITYEIANDSELMQIMRETGCFLLFIGFDSLQKGTLRQIEDFKSSPNNNLFYVTERLHRHNISVIGSFMFGFDGDKPGCILETTEAAIKAGIDMLALNIFTPIPGTAIYKKYLMEGRIIEKNFNYYDFKNLVFYPKNFSPDKLQKEYKEATERSYSIKSLSKRFRKMKNKNIMLLLNIFHNPRLSEAIGLKWRKPNSLTLMPQEGFLKKEIEEPSLGLRISMIQNLFRLKNS